MPPPPRRSPAQALGVIAALLLLALLVAFAARLGWEAAGRLMMVRLSSVDAFQLGIPMVAGVEFETDLLDTWRGRYRIVEITRNKNGDVEAHVERLCKLPPRRHT